MQLSIIIPSFKKAHLLKWGLYSLTKQNFSCPFEIIVLNDGIDDDTEQVCNSYKNKLNIRYIFTGQRNKDKLKWRVPGYVINMGVKQAKGKIIIIYSPDIFIVNNCLQEMVDKVLNNKKLIAITKGYDDRNGKFLGYVEEHLGDIKGFFEYKELDELNTKLPFFMGINKEEFTSIGGYDEDFTGYCFDDNDIVGRLIENGCNYYKINSTVVHLYHSRIRPPNIMENYAYLWNYNKKLYEERKGTIIRNQNKKWGKLFIY